MRRVWPVAGGGVADGVDEVSAYAFPDGVPWLRANMVSSVDGASRVHGRSGPLSDPEDKHLFGLLRQLADIILVGAGTARVERYGPVPSNAQDAQRRVAAGQSPAPGFAIVSGTLDLDPDAPLFSDAAPRTIVLTCDASPDDARRRLARTCDVVVCGADRVELPAAVEALHDRGHRHISCEGGPRLLGQLASAGQLDELCLTIAPALVSGPIPRILDADLIDPPLEVTLTQLLAGEQSIFARYAVRRPAP